VIPRAHIVAWRAEAPWSLDSQVEQDLVLSRAITDMFGEPDLSSAAAMRGGTVLHKILLRPPRRYSEDIDLVQTQPGPIAPFSMPFTDASIPGWVVRSGSRGRAG
jgi:hypothetical protein